MQTCFTKTYLPPAQTKLRTMWNARWHAMVQRCYDVRHPRFGRYGGRGIKIAWTDFDTFFKYIQGLQGWDNPDLSLDRINNSRNYEPGNLRMATRQQQMNNRGGE